MYWSNLSGLTRRAEIQQLPNVWTVSCEQADRQQSDIGERQTDR